VRKPKLGLVKIHRIRATITCSIWTTPKRQST